MINPHDMLFTPRQQGSDIYLRGEWLYECTGKITATKSNASKATTLMKDELKREMWEKTYGHLRGPLADLGQLATSMADSKEEIDALLKAVKCINDLMTYPKEEK